MKRPLMFLCMIITAYALRAQPAPGDIQLKNMRGAMISFSAAEQKDSLVLVCFWSVNSDESISELNAINANYEKWKKLVPFNMMAVSIDEGNETHRIRPLANSYEWKFNVYTDVNGDLRKALHSTNLPQAMILKNNKVVYEQSGFEAGSENYFLQKLQALAAGRS